MKHHTSDLLENETAFVDMLVDHMARVDEVTRKRSRIGPTLYIDSTLVGNSGAYRSQQGSAFRQMDVPWAHLYRVAMAAINLYCEKTFGDLFDHIPDSKQRRVLHLLDSIRFEFQDGSDAGVFYAVAYQRTVTDRVRQPS